MSFTITASGGRSLKVNAWNWRPTLRLLGDHALLDDLTIELLGYNGDKPIAGEQAAGIAAFLDAYLATLPAGARVMLDGSVTTAEDTGEFYRREEEMHLNYSAQREWLVRFRDFCRSATDGFS